METVSVKRRIVGGKDSRGRPIITFGEALPLPVLALAPGPQIEPDQPNRDLSLIQWTVYAEPHPNIPNELDRVVIDGDEYEVDGRPADWGRGLDADFDPGFVILLKRVEG